MKARYEDIASSGGKRAVKKAIDKKQKKISQKEKKSRPFPARQPGDSVGGSRKRPARFALAEEGSKPPKRKKFV
jgi:ribosomal RNA-processing protein 36